MTSEADCKALHDKVLAPVPALHAVEQQSESQAEAGVCGVRRVCLCGAGHGSHVMAALMASKGIRVSIFATRPQHVQRFAEDGLEISAVFPSESRTVTGRASMVTTDPEAAAEGADLVILCLPTFLHDSVLRAVVPFLRPETPVGAIGGG
eukprot:RCo038686